MKRLVNLSFGLITLVGIFGCESGVGSRIVINAPDSGHKDLWDAAFRRRHRDLKGHVAGDPMLEVAREITVLEDDIRRDGSITLKDPDVWGDGNLIAAIQEYERLMGLGANADFDKRFRETVQAFIARSDQAEFQSVTAIGMALGKSGTNGPASPTQISNSAMSNSFPNVLALPTTPIGKSELGVSLEPTELDRERSTFILANQGLRRRMIGDDNSRAAGYGLYLFRIPVSVLPGRDTTEGFSALVTLRAQLRVDRTHLRDTFSKMIIADLVEGLTPTVLANWEAGKVRKDAGSAQMSMELTSRLTPTRIDPENQIQVYGQENLNAIIAFVKQHVGASPNANKLAGTPRPQEVKRCLESLLDQTQLVLQENNLYEQNAQSILLAGDHYVKGQLEDIPQYRASLENSVAAQRISDTYQRASWMLAMQSAILDRNLKKILNDMAANGQLSAQQCASPESVAFFCPDSPETQMLWESIIRDTYPLHVFNLDPIAEQQNAYDAFSRRREMQVALAFSVANGNVLTADQKLKASRRLALDEATIALNRTAVAFAHSDDTFGWYFHPRIQTPPVESSNIGALARTIWSTGPTENYDRKHRRLEPGIRDCEVLIAMPSFVTDVSFDLTTNWEKVSRPGVTKRSYEEMIAQGGRLQRLRNCMNDPANQHCYRPGDYERLLSRIDQLEKMLGLQTHHVRLPYEHRQTGTGLFDKGNKQLAPSIDHYYGLSYLDPDQTAASFFLTGDNFHPTLSHVIVGGSEYHVSTAEPVQVEVLSRELLHVRAAKLTKTLSQDDKFEVRVGTPAGMSNPLVIGKQPSPPPQRQEPKASFDLAKAIDLDGNVGCKDTGNCGSEFCLSGPSTSIRIIVKDTQAFAPADVQAIFTVTRTRKIDDKTTKTDELGATGPVPINGLTIPTDLIEAAIRDKVQARNDYKAGDVLEVKTRLTFPNSSQPDVLMTQVVKITLSLSNCTQAAILPAPTSKP
jgi:hypothetical protein